MIDHDTEAVLAFLKKIGAKGGKSRAARHDKATLSKWAKKGGRPRKDGKKRNPNAK
jgi:general stress protein YciG